MRVHVLQHNAFEDLGCIKTWLQSKRASVSYTRFYNSWVLPDIDTVDMLIVLGGSMGVNDENIYPWLTAEKTFIAKAIQENKIILGICLGSQLIASALGANVYPNKEKEIGWFPIYAQQKRLGALTLPGVMEVFHWHGDTFDLPKDAVLLASSAGCQNQIFQVGKRIIGLQFHAEVTAKTVQQLIKYCGYDLVSQRFVQTAAEIRSVPAINYKVINSFMGQVLEHLLAGALAAEQPLLPAFNPFLTDKNSYAQ